MKPAVRLGALGMVLCLSGAMGFVVLAGTASASELDGLVMVSDYVMPSKVRIFDPARSTIVFDYRLEKEGPEPCTAPEATCAALGIHHLTLQDQDYLDVAVTVIDPLKGNLADGFYSIIQRVRLVHPVQEVWRLRELDFSDVPDGDVYCVRPPEGAEGEYRSDPRCQLAFNHAFRVVDDRPSEKRVTLIVADTLNERVEQVTLDYSNGSHTGHVDWVLGEAHPAWPPMGVPNGVQYIDDGPDGRFLLITFYTTTWYPLGGGFLMMLKWENGDWVEAWRFPDPNDGRQPYLNTPHMGEVVVDPTTGERRIWYSHSRGLATDWREMIPAGFGATYGMLIPGPTLADPPTYVFDAAPFLDDPERALTFSRDQSYLPDGTMLLADSACETMCSYTPRIYRTLRFDLDATTATDRTGCYTTDHSELNLIPIPDDMILDTYECGFHGIFEANWLDADSLGTQLRNARAGARLPCPGTR